MGKHEDGTPWCVTADLRFEQTVNELVDAVRRLEGAFPTAGSLPKVAPGDPPHSSNEALPDRWKGSAGADVATARKSA